LVFRTMTAVEKRGPPGLLEQAGKRMRMDTSVSLYQNKEKEQNLARIDPKSGARRTSSLLAPTMRLEGHKDRVFTCRFSRDGDHLASGGVDKEIFVWFVKGECQNHTMLRGHKNAVMQLQWSKDSSMIFSCSADETVAVWDVEAGVRVRKMTDHSSFVNSVSPSNQGVQLLVTGSDDGTAKIFDIRMKTSVKTFEQQYQVTAVSFDRYTTDIFVGGLDNSIKVFDIRKPTDAPKYELLGHLDTITDLKLHPEGTHLLSSSMDNSARVWDIRPFCKGPRETQAFDGLSHSAEKNLIRANWSPDGRMVSSGSSDAMVYVFDHATAKILFQLPGHKGSVNEVDFHPLEPIILSGSSDRMIYLGEL